MIRFLVLITLILTINFKVLGQNDWRPGFIIDNQMDTIHGLIDYRPNRSNGKICYFQSKNSKDKKAYSPNDIFGYMADNSKFYISKTIKINEMESKVFFQFLISGKANVYYFIDTEDHYFLEKDEIIYELKNSKINPYGDKYLMEKKEYIGMLNTLLYDANIQNDIKNTELTRSSLISLAKIYHEKVSDDEEWIVYKKKSKPIKINFGFLIGTNYSTLYLITNYPYSTQSEVNGDNSYFKGIILNFQNLPGIYERISLQLGLLANNYYLNNEKRNSLYVPISLDYKLTVKRFYPKIEFGVSSYFIRNDELNTQHMTTSLGLSLNYNFLNNSRVFVNARIENNPRIIRSGIGLLF